MNLVAYAPRFRITNPLELWLPKVYETSLWMMLHGAPSCKRTILYSNMPEVCRLDLGKLTKHEKETRTTKKLTSHLDANAVWFHCASRCLQERKGRGQIPRDA